MKGQGEERGEREQGVSHLSFKFRLKTKRFSKKEAIFEKISVRET